MNEHGLILLTVRNDESIIKAENNYVAIVFVYMIKYRIESCCIYGLKCLKAVDSIWNIGKLRRGGDSAYD